MRIHTKNDTKENTNVLIRQYCPKGAGLFKYPWLVLKFACAVIMLDMELCYTICNRMK
jgi:hypothetical protein